MPNELTFKLKSEVCAIKLLVQLSCVIEVAQIISSPVSDKSFEILTLHTINAVGVLTPIE